MRTRAEILMDRMLKAYPFCVIYGEVAFEYIEQGGQVDVEQFKEYLKNEGYWEEYYETD